MARLYVVTHAATASNENDRVHGWLDDPLSPAGHGEAAKLAKNFAAVPVDAIATADFDRTVATARAISKTTGAPITQISPAYRTWHVGEFTGDKESASRGDINASMEQKPAEAIPGGESFNEFKARLFAEVSSLLAKTPDKNVVLVTSKTSERALAGWIKAGMPQDGSIDMNEMKKPSDNPTVVAYERGGTPQPQPAVPQVAGVDVARMGAAT